MLRQLIQVGTMLALIMGPAFAQDPSSRPSIELNPDRPASQEIIEKRKANDAAYNAAMKKIPDKKASSDPWGDIRPVAPTVKNKQQQQ
jgi:hypothetical protein